MMAERQGRKWQITINNPADKGTTHEGIKQTLSAIRSVVYYCLADEIGLEQGTPHTHIFIAAKSGIRFSTVKKLFPEAHIEQAHGTSEENKAYIEKSGKWADDPKKDTSIEGTFEEWGEMPVERQGARTDLAMLYELVKDGKSNFEILEEYPDFMLRISDIEKTRQIIRAEEYRTTFRNLEVTYIWGATGTGKTRSVMEQYGYENVFRVTDYAHPFDQYAGQDILLCDEFHSQYKASEILDLMDGYPLELPCRYANKVACFTKVFLISNIDLAAQYPNIQYDSPAVWEAILRRIHKVVKFFKDGHTAEYSTHDYFHGLVEIEDEGNLPFADPPPEPPPECEQQKL